MSGTPLGRYNPKPKMRVQKAEVSVHTTTSATKPRNRYPCTEKAVQQDLEFPLVELDD